eukprot:274873-Chlamydomonas_euryale.AAC.1
MDGVWGLRVPPRGVPHRQQVGHDSAGVSLKNHLAQQRLRYLGHLSRLPDPAWAKHLLFAQPSTGTRARGRPE